MRKGGIGRYLWERNSWRRRYDGLDLLLDGGVVVGCWCFLYLVSVVMRTI